MKRYIKRCSLHKYLTVDFGSSARIAEYSAREKQIVNIRHQCTHISSRRLLSEGQTRDALLSEVVQEVANGIVPAIDVCVVECIHWTLTGDTHVGFCEEELSRDI